MAPENYISLGAIILHFHLCMRNWISWILQTWISCCSLCFLLLKENCSLFMKSYLQVAGVYWQYDFCSTEFNCQSFEYRSFIPLKNKSSSTSGRGVLGVAMQQRGAQNNLSLLKRMTCQWLSMLASSHTSLIYCLQKDPSDLSAIPIIYTLQSYWRCLLFSFFLPKTWSCALALLKPEDKALLNWF